MSSRRLGLYCSVQRQHPKIIEKVPVTIAKEETFEKMERTAVCLAKLVEYVSAGTVKCELHHIICRRALLIDK